MAVLDADLHAGDEQPRRSLVEPTTMRGRRAAIDLGDNATG